jgi:small subunit ribosomal protein S11
MLRLAAAARSALRMARVPCVVPSPVQLAMPRRPFALDAMAALSRSSSSTAGLEAAGMPRMEHDSKGRPMGLMKGGKGRRSLGGVIAIKNSWNNTLISISSSGYKQLGFVSAGTVGFKKAKRASQFATEKAISTAFAKARSFGLRRVMVSMRGPAISLRKPLFKSIREEVGIRIMKLRMNDNVPHGGCRPRKSRRRRWKTRARQR